MQQFCLDGTAYNVQVTKLTRKFSVMETGQSGRTQNGQMYRDLIGTFYNYSMTVEPRNGDIEAMDAFWEAISQPRVYHVCVFPYGQDYLTQEMYIVSGEQDLRRMTENSKRWGELSVDFVAMRPAKLPEESA